MAARVAELTFPFTGDEELTVLAGRVGLPLILLTGLGRGIPGRFRLLAVALALPRRGVALVSNARARKDERGQRPRPASPANGKAELRDQAEETLAQQVPVDVEVSAFGKAQRTLTQQQEAIV